MTEIEYLLTTMMEECAELQKECSKILRFGAGDRPPDTYGPTNIQRLQTEFCDLMGVIELLEERNLKVRRMDASMLVDIRAKKDKVRKFMQYSRERGLIGSDGGEATRRLRQAAEDFVYNVRSHNIVGGAEVEVDASFKELRAAMLCCHPSSESKTTPGDFTPSIGRLMPDPSGPT